MKTFRILVEGRVQGVGYRFFAVAEARMRGVKGTAKNLFDGRVEIIAQGGEDALQEYLDALKEGPRMGFVRKVSIDEMHDSTVFNDFKVAY